MTTRSLTSVVAPAAAGTSALLVAANWYVRPERAIVWAPVAALVALMAIAWRRAGRSDPAGAPARTRGGVASGIAVAAVVLAVSLVSSLGRALGLVTAADPFARVVMAVVGVFLAVTGNAIPKALAPLTSLTRAARRQAFQRAIGWTWVLAGLGVAAAALLLPLDTATAVSAGLLVAAIAISAGRVVSCRAAREDAAGRLPS